MKTFHSSALVDFTFDITWKKNNINHHERYFAEQFNCWRDIIPANMLERVLENNEKATVTFDVTPGELIPDYKTDQVKEILKSRLNKSTLNQELMTGRFYPQGLLSGLPGFYKENLTPFRCLDVTQKNITADLNHPMSGIPMKLSLTLNARSSEKEERGGRCVDWIELVLSGPGMQTRYKNKATQYLNGKSFDRLDKSPDSIFYQADRFVDHIDAMAQKNLSDLYRSLLRPEGTVLDLMASWKSHISNDLNLSRVHGLGLNKKELNANKQLSGHSVQDLNNSIGLTFNDDTFDAAICSLSVEYLTDPVAVFKEVARVLKPDGIFAVAFSNRWFEEKSTRIWKQLHDFEKIGLVTEYFIESEQFETLSTFSIRGYPRPYDDKYFGQLFLSDPVYAVIGKVKN